MDGGRSGDRVEINPLKNPHLDHGYAVTSHSSQGQTADRVLIHADTELGAKDLLNNRMLELKRVTLPWRLYHLRLPLAVKAARKGARFARVRSSGKSEEMKPTSTRASLLAP